MKPIQIVDAMMGKGKSSWAIQYMNENTGSKFVYVTPFLEECSRVKSSCHDRRFKEPAHLGEGKLGNLHELLANGHDIATTHALFKTYNEETIALIKQGGYTLILDEVIETCTIEDNLGKSDIPSMFELGLIEREDNGNVKWVKDDYDGKYNNIKTMAKNGSLSMVYDNSCILVWSFPVGVFTAFDSVYVLTYKFHSQENRYYYDMNNVPYEYNTVRKSADRYELVRTNRNNIDSKEDIANIKRLITIIDNSKMNAIGDANGALSSTWYKKKCDQSMATAIRKNLRNFYQNIAKAKLGEPLWTTFKNNEGKLKGKGYTGGFIACNARATNKYAGTKHLAYLVNIYLNPIKANFFRYKGVDIDEDGFALSEMVQWIWRSAIRNGEPITLYVPSKRMRELLVNYLEGETLEN